MRIAETTTAAPAPADEAPAAQTPTTPEPTMATSSPGHVSRDAGLFRFNSGPGFNVGKLVSAKR